MQRNDTRLTLRLLQEIRHRSRDESIADAMKAVLPQLVLLRRPGINWIRFYLFGHRCVERRIKVCDILRFWQSLHASFHDGEGASIVQGCKVCELLKMVVCILIDDMSSWIIPSVYDAMAGMCDVVPASNFGQSSVFDQLIQYVLASILVRLYAFDFLILDFLGTALIGQFGRRSCETGY